jgi:hypothetical protein
MIPLARAMATHSARLAPPVTKALPDVPLGDWNTNPYNNESHSGDVRLVTQLRENDGSPGHLEWLVQADDECAEREQRKESNPGVLITHDKSLIPRVVFK